MSDFPTKNPLTLAKLEKMGVRNMAKYKKKRDEIRSRINFVMFLGTGYEPEEEFEEEKKRKKE